MAEVALIVVGAIVGLILILVLYCWISSCVMVSRWRRRLNSTGKIIETSMGRIEYSILGNAPYVLALHGTPGMHDGDLGDFNHWQDAGFGVIAPSRPGYANTEINVGPKIGPKYDV